MPITAAILRQYVSPVLVETGTWHGDGVAAALRAGFERIYSIELSPELYERAEGRFVDEERVTLLCGTSVRWLPPILRDLERPATFWLDAHYSAGDTAGDPEHNPLLEELALLAAHPIKQHTILIDDIRLCGAELPPLDDIEAALRQINAAYVLSRQTSPAGVDDILVACP